MSPEARARHEFLFIALLMAVAAVGWLFGG